MGAPEPLPQAWVPRVVNAALAVFLLCCVAPVVTTLGRHTAPVRVFLVVAVLPVLLVVALCLASALRPGSLGRAARRLRVRRRSGPGPRAARRLRVRRRSGPGQGTPGQDAERRGREQS